MAKYSHDTVVPFKDSTLGKKQQIAHMFDRIAFRYDFLNRFLSGGIDVYWRKKAIRELAAGGAAGPAVGAGQTTARTTAPGGGAADTRGWNILDVATGTADMAIMMSRYLSPAKVTGIDISTGMLDIGRQKIAKLKLEDRIELCTGDSEAIHFPDNSFDAIAVAFGVRNFENLEKGLQEMYRVLKPGGRLVVLEFSQPKKAGFRQLYEVYLRLVAPGIGRILSKSREAYAYLNESVKAFPEGDDFVRILDKNDYIHTRLRRLSLGICTIYTGKKRGSQNPVNIYNSAINRSF
ncbi:MAG TPA: bifunctional demethylmenaquinone methyltransferase/2-methoxy-6-polyprenyl-1,4-benzoquinol methylase UbiE [Puia sp.]|nr:bifunctional demethylmenaquinone methyltransferase/2-methoxy-6-polyprenyl-1,4-benzoquinol methylase UbiE [Puia sp.]